MYAALTRRQLPRISALHITKLAPASARASVHEKAHSNVKANEEFFVTTAFPDDFESSPLKLDDLPEQDRVAMGNKVSEMVDKATSEQHLADIYESLFPREPLAPMKRNRAKAPKEAEQEPSLDEM